MGQEIRIIRSLADSNGLESRSIFQSWFQRLVERTGTSATSPRYGDFTKVKNIY
jgi:hypothetical protein